MKKSKWLLPIIIFVVVSLCFLTFQITKSQTDKMWMNNVDTMMKTNSSYLTEPLSELVNAVNENGIGNHNEHTLLHGAVNGYIESLDDDYAMYMSKEQYSRYLSANKEGTTVGIRIVGMYDKNVDGVYVVNVYDGSPAEKNGIVPGCIITGVDNVSVDELGFYGAIYELGKGEAGTEVAVSYEDTYGTSQTKTIAREVVTVENITGKKLKDGIGLIRINNFGGDAEKESEQFKSVLENLITDGCEKFVIDVRNNYGGNLETINKMLDFMVSSGTMYTVTDKAKATTAFNSDTKHINYPIAVLVNERTVCGAELFASVLKDMDKACIVGTTTCGKATMQSAIELSDGCTVSLSTTQIVPAGKTDFNKKGIVPDITAELTAEQIANYPYITESEDSVLQAAVEHLKQTENVKQKD